MKSKSYTMNVARSAQPIKGVIMITYYVYKPYDDSTTYVEMAFDTGDTLPVENIAHGSLGIDIKTGDMYAFDEVGETWNKL